MRYKSEGMGERWREKEKKKDGKWRKRRKKKGQKKEGKRVEFLEVVQEGEQASYDRGKKGEKEGTERKQDEAKGGV